VPEGHELENNGVPEGHELENNGVPEGHELENNGVPEGLISTLMQNSDNRHASILDLVASMLEPKDIYRLQCTARVFAPIGSCLEDQVRHKCRDLMDFEIHRALVEHDPRGTGDLGVFFRMIIGAGQETMRQLVQPVIDVLVRALWEAPVTSLPLLVETIAHIKHPGLDGKHVELPIDEIVKAIISRQTEPNENTVQVWGDIKNLLEVPEFAYQWCKRDGIQLVLMHWEYSLGQKEEYVAHTMGCVLECGTCGQQLDMVKSQDITNSVIELAVATERIAVEQGWKSILTGCVALFFLLGHEDSKPAQRIVRQHVRFECNYYFTNDVCHSTVDTEGDDTVGNAILLLEKLGADAITPVVTELEDIRRIQIDNGIDYDFVGRCIALSKDSHDSSVA